MYKTDRREGGFKNRTIGQIPNTFQDKKTIIFHYINQTNVVVKL